jgi:hypothetical protein
MVRKYGAPPRIPDGPTTGPGSRRSTPMYLPWCLPFGPQMVPFHSNRQNGRHGHFGIQAVFSLTIESTLVSMTGWVYLLYDEPEDVSSLGTHRYFVSGNEDVFITRCLPAEFKPRANNGFGCWSTAVLIDMMWATLSRSPNTPELETGFRPPKVSLPASHRRCQGPLGVITGPLGSNRLLDVATGLGSNLPGPVTDPANW